MATNLDNAKPHLNPNNPAVINKHKINSTHDTIMNEVNGGVMINDFVPGNNPPVPDVENPYLIGGKKLGDYQIFYRNKKYNVKSNSLVGAIRKFWEEKCTGKDCHLVVKKINKNRKTATHTFSIKKKNGRVLIEKIKSSS